MSVRERIRGLAGRARSATSSDADRRLLRRLEERMEHLESLVEGLQDAVHRESVRHDERLSELEHRTQPEALAKMLSEDARRRGL